MNDKDKIAETEDFTFDDSAKKTKNKRKQVIIKGGKPNFAAFLDKIG